LLAKGKTKASYKTRSNTLSAKGFRQSRSGRSAWTYHLLLFFAGAANSFPLAQITFDRFHVIKLLNEAMDKVRRLERNEQDALKGYKYLFLKNEENLKVEQKSKRDELVQL